MIPDADPALAPTLPFAGELAAVLTACSWALASILFARVGGMVGARSLNRSRVLIAFGFLVALHLAIEGSAFPTHAAAVQWGWLAVSSIVGLVIGDTLLFTAYIRVGPRLGTLMMTTVPIFGVTMGFLAFGHGLTPVQLAGIALGVGGVVAVIADRGSGRSGLTEGRAFRLGLAAGVGAAFCQAVNLVAAKQAMLLGDLSPLSATVIRTAIAGAVLWAVVALRGGAVETVRSWARPGLALPLVIGSLIGPALGIWLSMIAVRWTHVGVAATLMALPPVLLIPYDVFVARRRVSAVGIAGTLVALAGVAVLFNA
jgi:drug/metabolite transporter (DMT)-like permease